MINYIKTFDKDINIMPNLDMNTLKHASIKVEIKVDPATNIKHYDVTGNFQTTFYQEDGVYMAEINGLGVMSYGDTIEEANKNLLEAVELFLEDIVERNVVVPVLNELGWNVQVENNSNNELKLDHPVLIDVNTEYKYHQIININNIVEFNA